MHAANNVTSTLLDVNIFENSVTYTPAGFGSIAASEGGASAAAALEAGLTSTAMTGGVLAFALAMSMTTGCAIGAEPRPVMGAIAAGSAAGGSTTSEEGTNGAGPYTTKLTMQILLSSTSSSKPKAPEAAVMGE